MGFAVILVNASDRQDESRTCAEVDDLDCLIGRPNEGYDFGSWATGILHCADVLHDLDELILVNDSAFGRIAPLEPRLSACTAPFVCLTDSYQVSHHGQSYFLRFGREPLESGAVLDFFERYPFTNKKRDVIRNGEIGLSTAMLDGGFGIHALFPYEQASAQWIEHAPKTVGLIKETYRELGLYGSKTMNRRLDVLAEQVESVLRNVPANPSHLFWRTLISESGFPFIKRELLLKNPIGVADLFPMMTTRYVEAIGAENQVVEYLDLVAGIPLIQSEQKCDQRIVAVN
nr:rhamnan synthesis F family protein [Lolliginicoccus lacisalsi]